MYLAIMLIIVSILVFYNEINSKMNIAEIGLFVIALIAIIRASLNYIQIDDVISTKEGFSNYRPKKRHVKSKMEDVTILKSEESNEYFDTEKFNSINNKSSNTKSSNNRSSNNSTDDKINKDAVSQVNSLLGLGDSNISKFNNIPNAKNPTNTNPNLDNAIESVFRPQIIVGKGANDAMNSNSYGNSNLNGITNIGLGEILDSSLNSMMSNAAPWRTAFSNDGMTFKNTMAPTNNLWGTDINYDDVNTNWTQSMNDYNNGKWNPKLYQKPSDYTDYYEPSAYGMSSPPSQPTQPKSKQYSNFDSLSSTTTPMTTTPVATTLDSYGQPQKLCGAYDDLSMDQAGNLVVRNYTQAKKWVPGYTYVPPVYWDVPQRHVSICQPAGPNLRKLTGLIDRGLPINALELNPDGSQAQTEDTVTMTNVGSLVQRPQFNYQEEPFSKPYV